MVAFEQPRNAITLVPGESFEKKQYTFGTCDAEGKLITPGAGVMACGVVQTPGIAGEPCNVMTSGVSFIILGGTVAAGDAVSTDAAGKAVKAADGAVLGVCLVGGAAGEIGSILLK